MNQGTLFAPEVALNRLPPRPYQREAIDAIFDRIHDGDRSTALVMATGTGKTVVFANFVREAHERFGWRALVLAHRDELISQAAGTFDKVGVFPAVEKASLRARAIGDPDVVIGSVATLQGARLAEWPRDYFDLIVTDEMHHAAATSYRRIYGHFKHKFHLGVTATPGRADNKSLSSIFQTLAYELNLIRAIREGHLCDVVIEPCDVQIDLRGLRPKAGDYTEDDLARRIGPMIGVLANAIKQATHPEWRKTLNFLPTVASAQGMATALESLGLTSDWIAGDDPGRAEKIRRFQRGELMYLSNCNVLLEGFDCPSISALGLCRPTRSQPLLTQMVGRGTRNAAYKSNCIILDFPCLTDEHDLATPMSLFDGYDIDPEVVQILEEKAVERQGRLSLMDALEDAEKVHKERQVLRIKATEREIRYKRKTRYSLASMTEAVGFHGREFNLNVANRATEPQIKFLERLGFSGIPDLNLISKRRASQLIEHMKTRRNKPTGKQVHMLVAHCGIPLDEARDMERSKANEILSAKFAEWGPRR